jgi:hypothetical protein
MRKGHSCQGHAQIFHVRKVGLGPLCWHMDLFEDHLLLRSMERFPPRNMPLQGADLNRLIATGCWAHNKANSVVARPRRIAL